MARRHSKIPGHNGPRQEHGHIIRNGGRSTAKRLDRSETWEGSGYGLGCYKRERIANKRIDQEITRIVAASVSRSNDSSVSTCKKANQAVAANLRAPTETNSRHKVVCVSNRLRGEEKSQIVAVRCHKLLVLCLQAAEGISRILIAKPEAQGKSRADAPLVLCIDIGLIPAVVSEKAATLQWQVHRCDLRAILNEVVQSCILQPAPGI